MSKYSSVDILFHFDVDAETPAEARRQADKQLRNGAVGCSVVNPVDMPLLQSTLVLIANAIQNPEPSIPEELLSGVRLHNKAIQELAEATKTCIYDNNSLELAIERICPSKIKRVIEKLQKEAENRDRAYEYRDACNYALELLDAYG